MRRSRQRPAAWLALVAMLLGCIAPTLGRAMTAGDRGVAPAFDVCTVAAPASNVDALPVGRGPLDGEGRKSAHAPDHCPYCCLQAGAAMPPPATRAPLVAERARAPAPACAVDVLALRDDGSPAQPRAPPRRA